jgi:hypothetical protein
LLFGAAGTGRGWAFGLGFSSLGVAAAVGVPNAKQGLPADLEASQRAT